MKTEIRVDVLATERIATLEVLPYTAAPAGLVKSNYHGFVFSVHLWHAGRVTNIAIYLDGTVTAPPTTPQLLAIVSRISGYIPSITQPARLEAFIDGVLKVFTLSSFTASSSIPEVDEPHASGWVISSRPFISGVRAIGWNDWFDNSRHGDWDVVLLDAGIEDTRFEHYATHPKLTKRTRFCPVKIRDSLVEAIRSKHLPVGRP